MLERLFCTIFGHRYVVERVLNAGARKVGCTRCGRHWAMHDGTRSFVQWDGEFEAFYAPGGMLAEAAKDAPSNEGCVGDVKVVRIIDGHEAFSELKSESIDDD